MARAPADACFPEVAKQAQCKDARSKGNAKTASAEFPRNIIKGRAMVDGRKINRKFSSIFLANQYIGQPIPNDPT
jgi:hypothetical protein